MHQPLIDIHSHTLSRISAFAPQFNKTDTISGFLLLHHPISNFSSTIMQITLLLRYTWIDITLSGVASRPEIIPCPVY